MIEFIADPPDAENITGILRVDFQLFPQVADVDHHRPGIPAKALCLPGQLKNLLCPSLTAKQKQNLLYPLGFKEILLVVQSIKM